MPSENLTKEKDDTGKSYKSAVHEYMRLKEVVLERRKIASAAHNAWSEELIKERAEKSVILHSARSVQSDPRRN